MLQYCGLFFYKACQLVKKKKKGGARQRLEDDVLPNEAVENPSMEVFKTQVDEAMGNLL